MSTLAVGQIRKFTGKYCFPHQLRIDRIEGDRTVVFGNCCGGDAAVEIAHEHATHDLHAETVLISQPIPEPAPELCTVSSCGVGDETCSRPTPGTKEQHDRRRLKFPSTHDFVAPQAKPLIAKPADVYAGAPITGTAKPVLREPMPLATPEQIKAAHADLQRYSNRQREQGPSVVDAASAIEPWRPSVDEFDLLPDAETGWRR